MSKTNAIRKKALELARKRDWAGAIKEYKRLAEAEQSNPNVFNELGDLHLKAGNKAEAYDAFDKAIDAYATVGLHNNAVAVCKKILRVLPGRIDVLVKLGTVRARQGLAREAESFYRSYLEKAALDPNVDHKQLEKSATAIIEEMPESLSILQFTADCLVKHSVKDKACEVLIRVHPLHQQAGDAAAAIQVEETLRQLGFVGEIPTVATTEHRQVITEDNLWTESHSEGERIDVESRSEAPSGEAVSIGEGASADATEAIYEYGNLEVDDDSTRGTATSAPPPAGVETGEYEESPDDAYDFPDEVEEPAEAPAVDYDMSDEEVSEEPQTDDEVAPDTIYEDVIREISSEPEPYLDDDPISAQSFVDDVDTPSEAEKIRVKMIVSEDGGEGNDGITEEDYRSHYDMGMAYLEMELYEEALREYQFASRSPQFSVKSMEMMGLCFLKQGQATLAIKQLARGLELLGADDVERLGIKYTLGLAYELAGDYEKAKSQFEDVYVSDVTFRDVARKITQYT